MSCSLVDFFKLSTFTKVKTMMCVSKLSYFHNVKSSEKTLFWCLAQLLRKAIVDVLLVSRFCSSAFLRKTTINTLTRCLVYRFSYHPALFVTFHYSSVGFEKFKMDIQKLFFLIAISSIFAVHSFYRYQNKILIWPKS